MLKQILLETKLPKELQKLLKEYDPYVDYIDDGVIYAKTLKRNKEIEREFKKQGYDIKKYLPKVEPQKSKPQDDGEKKSNFVAISTKSVSEFKDAKECGDPEEFLSQLDPEDRNEIMKKKGKDWGIAIWANKNDNVGTVILLNDKVLCSGDKDIAKKVKENFIKYYKKFKNRNFRYAKGFVKIMIVDDNLNFKKFL